MRAPPRSGRPERASARRAPAALFAAGSSTLPRGALAVGAVLSLAFATAAQAEEPQVQPPRMDCARPPDYPPGEEARSNPAEVVARLYLDAAGAVTALVLVHPLAPAFDAAALDFLRGCTYRPATRAGQPVASEAEVKVTFQRPLPPATLAGEVLDPHGAPVAGASVSAGGATAVTDAAGAFALTLPAPLPEPLEVTVVATRLDAAIFSEELQPGETRRVRYRLRSGSPGAVVQGQRLLAQVPAADPGPTLSHYTITRATIEHSLGAMEDISRVVANLPGVVADPDLLATLFVRGGGPDELIQYLDGVPLENPFHLGGFTSVFNPMLIDHADFSVGVSPARYQPALSGALDVRYATGATDKVRAEADLSIQSAKARLDLPTGVEGLSVLVSARRTFFELYFAGLRAAGVVGSNLVAPDISELFGRVHYRRGSHHISLSYLRAADGFAILAKAGEASALGFDGGITLSNVLQLGALEDRIDLGGGSELRVLAAVTNDADATSVSGDNVFVQDVSRFEATGSASLKLALSENSSLDMGLQARRRRYAFHGDVPDSRGLPPWAALPLVATGEPNLTVSPQDDHSRGAAYADWLLRPVPTLAVEIGARLEADLAGTQVSYSTRLAASLALPTATIAKAEAGIATQPLRSPLPLDPALGNPALLPERSKMVVVGLEQPLPFRALLRLEGYAKWLDHLAVNPDSDAGVRAAVAAGQPVYQSLGTGLSRGVDLLLFGRMVAWSYGVSAGLLRADRTNPLATGTRTYPAPWDQRFTLAADGSYAWRGEWIFSGRLTFHTGRPITPVASFTRDEAKQVFVPVFGDTNSGRYPNYFEAALRAERRFTAFGLPMAWYLELLNAANVQNVFVYNYGKGDFAANQVPSLETINHLPIRPFFGVRGGN